jgi:hypothetical protein
MACSWPADGTLPREATLLIISEELRGRPIVNGEPLEWIMGNEGTVTAAGIFRWNQGGNSHEDTTRYRMMAAPVAAHGCTHTRRGGHSGPGPNPHCQFTVSLAAVAPAPGRKIRYGSRPLRRGAMAICTATSSIRWRGEERPPARCSRSRHAGTVTVVYAEPAGSGPLADCYPYGGVTLGTDGNFYSTDYDGGANGDCAYFS